MKNVRGFFLLFCFLITTVHAVQPFKPIVCSQKYVLCTSAPCIPDPRHPNYAVCSCLVKQGASAGYKTCEQRKPKQYPDKTTRLISTFSFAQYDTKKAMTCSKGMPWTDCVDAPCTVNPMNRQKAICSCPIKHTQSFLTFGGDCRTRTCATGFWSGATDTAATALQNAMFKKLNITSNPWSHAACSSTDTKPAS